MVKGCWVDLSAVRIDILISLGQQAGSRELRVDYLRLLLLRLHGFANVIVKTLLGLISSKQVQNLFLKQ